MWLGCKLRCRSNTSSGLDEWAEYVPCHGRFKPLLDHWRDCATVSRGDHRYLAQEDETPLQISKKLHISVDELLNANKYAVPSRTDARYAWTLACRVTSHAARHIDGLRRHSRLYRSTVLFYLPTPSFASPASVSPLAQARCTPPSCAMSWHDRGAAVLGRLTGDSSKRAQCTRH